MKEMDLFKKLCAIKKTPVDPHILNSLQTALSSGELDLSGCSVGVTDWEVLAEVLLKSKEIFKLNFSDSMIPPAGVEYICKALTNHTTVVEVNLYGNNINSIAVSKLGEMIAVNTSIKKLVLNWNNFGGSLESFSAFCNGLSKNDSLEHLDLRNNQICSGCAHHLSEALKLNNTLKSLDLRWNRLKNEGVECLQTALQHNKCLKELLLKGNFAQGQKTFNFEHLIQQNEEMDNIKMEYDLKIDFLLKELKKLEEDRIQQISKITQISQQRFNEMKTKCDKFAQMLIKQERHLRCLQLEKRAAGRELLKEKEKKKDLKSRVDYLGRKKNELEKTIAETRDKSLKVIDEMEIKLQLEREQIDKLSRTLNSKDIELQNMKDDIVQINIKWEAIVKEKAAQAQHVWKKKLEEAEDNFGKQIAELREKFFQKDLEFLKEEEQKLRNIRSRAEEAENKKSLMEAEVSQLQDSNRKQESKIVRLEKDVTVLSTDLETTKQDLKNEQIKNHKYNEIIQTLNDNLIEANKTIEKLKLDVLGEKEKVKHSNFKLEEANSRIEQMRGEEKLRSELLTSALKRYLLSSADS